MRMERLRPMGRMAVLLSAAALGLSAISTPSWAADDTEYLLGHLAIGGVIDALARQLDTTCPTCTLPKVGTTDITGVTVAIAVGEIKPNAGATPGNIGAVPAVLASCQHYLTQFLGNTEYLGPLLDYGVCLETNSVPAVMATLPAVTANVQFLAGACTIITKAGYRQYTYKTEFRGTTDCTLGSNNSPNIFGTSVSGTAPLGDFLYDTLQAPASVFGARGIGTSLGTKTGMISSIAKVKFQTLINPDEASWCPSGATCGYRWVVAPNKNVDTGSSVQCTQTANNLDCRANSIPLTSTTIYKY